MFSIGGFLNSSFWSNFHGFQQTAESIEECLNREDCTVEMLLDDDNIIQEVKNQNPKLIDFWNREKIKKLIEYITVMPEENADHKRGHKFPFIASEILNCDSRAITELFFTAVEDDGKESEKKKDEVVRRYSNLSDEEGVSEQKEATAKDHEEEKEENDEVVHKEEDEEGENTKVEKEDEKMEVEDKAEEKKEEPAQETQKESTEETKEETPKETGDEKPIEEPENEQTTAIVEDAKIATNDEQKQDTEPLIKTREEEKTHNHDEEHKAYSQTMSTAWTEQTQEKKHKFDLLDKLFAFVKNENEINPVLAGYFNKLLNIFINKKPKELYNHIFHVDPEIPAKLVQHINSKAISEILIKLLNMDVIGIEDNQYDDNDHKSVIVHKLVDFFGPDHFTEEHLNVCQVLCELSESRAFYTIFTSDSILQKLFKYIQSNNDSSLRTGLHFVMTLCNQLKNMTKSKTDSSNNHGEEDDVLIGGEDKDEQNASANAQSPLIEYILEALPYLINRLEGDPDHEINTTYGDNIKPLGMCRLKIVEFLHALIRLNDSSVNRKLKEIGAFDKVLQLFKKYEWHNILHLRIDAMFTDIINCDSKDLKDSLLYDSKFVNELLEMAEKGEYKLASGREVRRGYKSVLIKLSNLLTKSGVNNQEVKRHLESIPTWEKYVNTTLKKRNELDTTSLGGHHTKNFDDSNNGEEEESSKFELDMEKLFRRFTSYKKSYTEENEEKEEEDEEEQEQPDEQFEDFERDNNSNEEVEEEEEEKEHKSKNRYEDDIDKSINNHINQFISKETPETDQWIVGSANTAMEDTKEDEEEKEEKQSSLVPLIQEKVETPEEKAFLSNTYWKVDPEYKLEDLIKEMNLDN